MYQKFRRATALFMAAFMAASSAQSGIYASSLETERGSISTTDETGAGEIATGSETEGFASAPTITQEPASKSDIYSIALDVRSSNGVVVFNEGKDTEQTVSISTNDNNETVSSVINANGELLKQYLVTDASPYAVVWTQGSGDTVNIKAVANDGYTVSSYESYVLNQAGNEYVLQDIGFLPETYITYDCTVTADTNRVIAVDFTPLKTSDDDIEIESVIVPAPETVPEEPVQNEAPQSEAALPMTEEAATAESEASPVMETELAGLNVLPAETEEAILESPEETELTDVRPEETASTEETQEVRETEAAATDESEGILPEEEMTETEEAVAEEPVMVEEETEVSDADTFADDTTQYNFQADFTSMRLVVLASDPSIVIDPEHIIGNYDNIYLLQYKTVQQTMAAYAYYLGKAEAVEPDAVVETAEDMTNDAPAPDVDNPVSNIENAADIPAATAARVIALLDTGVSDRANIIGRVSLIDDELNGNGHGDDMADAILSQNPDAQILSVRVMNDGGKGTIASIVSGIEYAIEQNVSIINLSVYGKNTVANTVLEKEINKAISLGITVVGAAGNDGANVAGFVPGRIEGAYILGACDETGAKIESSNYGSTVDYYAVAESTSQAAAMFSGYISANGVESLDGNGPTFFAPGNAPSDPDIEPETGVQGESEEESEEIPPESEEETEAPVQEPSGRPKNGSEVTFTETFWYRDKYYNFADYNPYSEDPYVVTTFVSGDDVDFETVKPGDAFVMSYKHTAADEEDHTWTSKVTFSAESLLVSASVTSQYAERILPSWIPQSGSLLPLPELSETTIEGLRYTVPQGTEDFSLDKLNNGYDVKKFRIWAYENGGFDINTIGTYEVLYRASYFMDPEHEWFVKSTVEVVPAEENVNTVRNESDSIKVVLNDETDVPFGIPVSIEGNTFTLSVEAWNTNMFNEISPRITIMDSENADITEAIAINEEKENGITTFSVTLPEDKTEMTVIVKDEANELVYDGKNSYSGNWRAIDADNLGYSSLTEEEFAELEAYYDNDYDPEDAPLEFGDDTFTIAAKKKLAEKTWKQSSSLKLFGYNGMKSADWNDTFKWYHAIRVTITSALAAKVKAYVAANCKSVYWSDTLQKKFDKKIDKYVNDYLMRLVCTANDDQHIGLNLKGWYDVDAKYFLKQTGSNAPKFTISGTYTESTDSNNVTKRKWTFKIKGIVNPEHAAHGGKNHQTFAGSKSFSITETEDSPYPFSVTKVNSDRSLPAHLRAYQNLSATFYVCTDPSNPKGSVVPDGIISTGPDGSTDDSVGDLEYGTTYYCWEDPASTVNYTAGTNPIAFNNPVGGPDTLELDFPNAPVKMNISLRKLSSASNITDGNRMYNLSNIPFTIWSEAQGIIRTPHTGENGEWTENDLWKDNYVVQETGQGTGYKTSNSPQSVTPANGTTQLTYTLDYPNEPLYATLGVLMKKDPTPSQTANASLAGATFRIDYYDEIPRNMDRETVLTLINNSAVTKSWQETSEANGDVKINNSPYTDPLHPENDHHIIPLGTVVITELTPPTNGRYYVNSTKVIATITQNGNSVNVSYYQLTDEGSWVPTSN